MMPSTHSTFDQMVKNDHEQIIYCYDQPTGLKVIIAIHNTVLGPALGGMRIWHYAHEEAARIDALRLSQGMTYKAAISGLDLGGGKAVVIGEVHKLKTEATLRKYGRWIDALNGRYITAPDVNTTIDDMEYIAKETKHVVGLPTTRAGSGDPSLLTAYGTYLGMKAAVKKVYGQDSLQDKKIGVQGAGKVGSHLIDHLVKEGADVYVTDITQDRLAAIAQQYRIKVVQPDEFYAVAMDIYAPCALGATLNDETIAKLKCRIIAGAANNQLADEHRHGTMLLEKNIIYAPDFLINAGGLINAHTELYGAYNQALAYQYVERIYGTCLAVLTRSAQENMPSQAIAKRMAQERIEAIKNIA